MQSTASLGTVRTTLAQAELEDYDFRRATYEALLRAHPLDDHALDAAFDALDAAHARLRAAHLALRAARRVSVAADTALH